MLKIILFEPDIPQNTGNIIRLCANTGCELHLVKPLGFPLDDKKLKRAGLDYHEYANIVVHQNWQECKQYFINSRIIAVETCGNCYYNIIEYTEYDVILFGSETRGLPKYVLQDLTHIVRIPMKPNQRSLNLSNSVAIVVFEAWRQLNYIGGT